MPFVAIANTAKLEIKAHSTLTLQPFVNVLHGKCSAAPSLGNMQDMAGAVSAGLLSGKAALPSTWQLDSVTATDLNSSTGPQYVDLSEAGLVGGNTGQNSPAVCALSKLLTSTRGRSFRGRIYWPVAEADVGGDGGLLAEAQTEFNALLNAIRSNLQGLTPASDLVVASRKLGTSHVVVSTLAEGKVGTQRRRVAR
jgi:hypothetical protein